VLVAAVVTVLAACGGNRTSAAADPRAAVLHAGDLPRGYREGDDTACGVPSATEGDWPQLERLFGETRPDACAIELQRVWAPSPGQPGAATSAAFVFGSSEDAERGYRAQVELLRFTASLDAQRIEDADLGDEAHLVHGSGLNDPATALVWRSGNVIALLAVEPANEKLALELARRQQELIQGDVTAAPPFNPEDDLELPLDDPASSIPVYWLGRTFAPGGGLPALELSEAYAGSNGAQLGYTGTDSGEGGSVRLEMSRPETWRREWGHTRLGRLIWDSPCARKTVVALADGRAEIYEGYGVSRPLKEPCPTTEPDRVVAHVYLGEVLVRVNMPYCYSCGLVSDGNPYDTVAGMTAVARGLKIRPRS